MNIVLAIIWAALGVPLSFIAKGPTFFACLGIAVLPLALALWRRRRDAALARLHFDELLRLAEMPKVEGLHHLEENSGIAIDPSQRKILLVAGKAARAYPFESVRGWEARRGERTSHAVRFNLPGALLAGTSNQADARLADAGTGLFVWVADAEHAEWRISMFDQRARANWSERMRQLLGDGRTRPASISYPA